MIIKCGKCETSFRFDENLMEGDGEWFRCSRCQDVFFHDNPAKGEQKAVLQDAGIADVKPDEVEPVMAKVSEIREAMEEDLGAVKEFDAPEEPADEDDDMEETPTLPEGRRKSRVGRIIAYLFLVIFILVISGGIYLWAIPEDRQHFMEFVSSYIPAFEKFGGTRHKSPLTFQGVRQHFVNNWLMGNIRVMEGNAINTAGYSLTRIQVRGRLYDAKGRLLLEKASFCGNLLTDTELTTLTEEEIQKKLGQPLQGSAAPGDRLKPGGQIPFMIVFFHEPPAVARATVMPAGAEKLLE